MKHRGPREGCFTDIQRIILCNPDAEHVAHLVMALPKGGHARTFLRHVLNEFPLAVAPPRELDAPRAPWPGRRCNLGLSFRGLQQLAVPDYVLQAFRSKSVAFTAGAPMRAAQYLSDTDVSAAPAWDARFGLDAAHAVITLHSTSQLGALEADVESVLAIADEYKVERVAALCGSQLTPPEGQQGRWTHFGFRDGLSKVRIRGWSRDAAGTPPVNELGDFVLGYPNQDGFNPWVLSALPARIRSFFLNASFGVLRQIVQDEASFKRFVESRAAKDDEGRPTRDSIDWIKAKLCGRWPDGSCFELGDGVWRKGGGGKPPEDLSYAADPEGEGCPFGSHVRRMNPRGGDISHHRHRPLIRRGTPYGPAYDKGEAGVVERGLLGLFFCASVEDQFEHLLGEWGDRVPLGSEDKGRAKDPLVGQHDDGTAAFVIPDTAGGDRRLHFYKPFVRTRGTVYAFYPGQATVDRILSEDDGRFWRDDKEDGL